MNKKEMLKGALLGGFLLAVGGCYNYEPVPKATLGDSFTHREKDKNDKLLDNIKKLSLADAQRIALHNNPTYIAAHHAIRQAEFKLAQAYGAFSPTIKADFTLSNGHNWLRNAASYGITDRNYRKDTLATSTGVTATWLLFSGLSRVFAAKAAQGNVEYSKLMDADYCREMMYGVAQAYNNVLLAIAKRRIAEENRKFQQITLKDTNYKFQAGAVPLSDVLNFEIQMNSADVDLIDADYSYDISLFALAVMMGYPDGTLPRTLQFNTELNLNFHELPPVELYLDTALANRPDLKGYRTQLEVARYQLYQKYSAYSPTVSAFADYSFSTNEISENTDDSSRKYENNNHFSYGIQAEWTIFNGLIRYNEMREYQAGVAIADYNVAAQWFTVVGEVRAAHANYIQNVKKTYLNKKIRDLAAKQRDLVDDEYRAGNAELTRLNEAQRDLVSYESQLATSYVAVQNAKAQLEYTVGANTAAYYEIQKEGDNEKTPGLESLKNQPAVKLQPTQAKGKLQIQNVVSNTQITSKQPVSTTPRQKKVRNVPAPAPADPAPAAPAQAPVIPANPTDKASQK